MRLNHFGRLIDQFSKTRILVIGDLMVDRFIRGKVSRISPEAPVPIVLVKEEKNAPGGAGNVCMNLASLGARVMACGVIGEDEAGQTLVNTFSRAGVRTAAIKRDSSLSTSLKTRVIAEHQQVVRFDQEFPGNLPHHVQSALLEEIPQLIRDSDGVILSDYGKGVITKALLTKAIFFSRKLKRPICVDPKLEHFQRYKKVTCITPNLGEAMGGMHRLNLNGDGGLERLGKDILKRLQCRSVLITQGEEGMTLFEKSKRPFHIPVKAREVFDVTGAGDTVISVLSLAISCGASLPEAAMLSNLAAGIVVGKLGTATVSPDELKEALKLL